MLVVDVGGLDEDVEVLAGPVEVEASLLGDDAAVVLVLKNVDG